MENYSKGKNVEEPLDRDKIPIPNLPEGFLWMQVRGSSKIRNLVSHALHEFPQTNSVVWTGFGPAVGKTISCAEIMKREYDNNLHQINKICYRLVEEYWDPKIPELDQLIVKRNLPMIHILLSQLPLDDKELGYQGPGATVKFQSGEKGNDARPKPKSTSHTRTPTKEFAELGVDSKKRPRRSNQIYKRKPGKNVTPATQPDHQSTSTDL